MLPVAIGPRRSFDARHRAACVRRIRSDLERHHTLTINSGFNKKAKKAASRSRP